MIIRKSIRWRGLFRDSWATLLFMLLYSAGVVLLYEWEYADLAVPTGIESMLGMALSILLAFQTNSAYGRWWEARKIWGAIVNDSRSFARQILSLIGGEGDEPAALRKEMVYRQIGWNYALMRSLRRQPPLADLEGLLAPGEIEALASQANVPNALLQTQGERVRDARAAGYLDKLLSLPLEETLARITDHMGRCERIKNTPFPTPYSYIVSRLLWLFLTLLPPGLVEHLHWLTIPVAIMVALIFLLINLIGLYIQDPFENRSCDTPMHTLCRTIEINLRQQLGETELPEMLEPDDGVLM